MTVTAALDLCPMISNKQQAYLFNREGGGVSFSQGTKLCWLSSGFTCTFSGCACPCSFEQRTLPTWAKTPCSLSWTLPAARQILPSLPAQTKGEERGGERREADEWTDAKQTNGNVADETFLKSAKGGRSSGSGPLSMTKWRLRL